MFGDPNYSQRRSNRYPTTPVASTFPIISTPENYGRNHETCNQPRFKQLPNTTNSSFLGEVVPRVTLDLREHDERIFETFLENKNEFLTRKKNDDCDKWKISSTKTVLQSVYKLNRELHEISLDLKRSIDIPEHGWQEKIDVCQKKRAEIVNLLGKLENTEVARNIKQNLLKRRKRRLREKRQRTARKLKTANATERRAQFHIKADAWIEGEREAIEKGKQEEDLRKDADIVLAEVRGKRSDARKFLSLLQELQNLRRVKASIARARGEHMSTAADEAFNNIIAKLMEQWTAIDREYSIEEQGIKLMLQTDKEQKIEKRKRNIFADWEVVLFGRKLPSTDLFQRNLNTFVIIRAAWDKFIDCNGQGSPIPIGWVMPDPPSFATWEKYLKKEL